MDTFRTRLSRRSEEAGPIILANDYGYGADDLVQRTIQNISTLHPFLCGLKLNFHLILPLGHVEISKINSAAHRYGLLTIADIKLNDIGNTNDTAASHLWSMGFDAVIVNPIIGPESLAAVVRSAHEQDCGVISLCHMSTPEARTIHEISIVREKTLRPYQLFLEWAISCHTDGIIVGATYPDIIEYCAKEARGRPCIFSPGVGAQGGDPRRAISAGSDYLIVGRSILEAADPKSALEKLHSGLFKRKS